MNKTEELIEFVKSKGACSIGEIASHFGYTKKEILIIQRRTYHLVKPNRKQDIIIYVAFPTLPEKFSDLLIDFRKPETIEDLIFIFLCQEKIVPSYYQIKNMNKEYNFPYNWNNRNGFHSSRKLVLNMLKDCGFLDKENNFIKDIE